MSLWADYIKERMGHEALEEEWGFVTYSFKPPFCCIEDIYVRPAARAGTRGLNLYRRVADIAKERPDITHLWTQVWVGEVTTMRALRCNIAVGFQVIGAENGRIIMAKDLRGKDG